MIYGRGAIISILVISRKEGGDATVPRSESPLSSQEPGAVAVTATAGGARGVALRAGQVHGPELEHDLPAHPPQWAVHAHPGGYDRAAVCRAARDPERVVRVRKAVVAHPCCTTPSGTLSPCRSVTTAVRVRPRSTSTTTWLRSRAIRQRRAGFRSPPVAPTAAAPTPSGGAPPAARGGQGGPPRDSPPRTPGPPHRPACHPARPTSQPG